MSSPSALAKKQNVRLEEGPTENRCDTLQKTLRSPLVAVWAGRYLGSRKRRTRLLSLRWPRRGIPDAFAGFGKPPRP